MLKDSAFLGKVSKARQVRESRFCLIQGIILALCGFSLLMSDTVNTGGAIVLACGWLSLFSLTLAILRPAVFGRGILDSAACLLEAVALSVAGIAVSAADTGAFLSGRPVFAVLLFCCGTARLLSFRETRGMFRLPLQFFCGVYDLVTALLLVLNLPGSGYQSVYWLVGMAIVAAGFENVDSGIKLYYKS